ncbi:MAG: hypothetical protein ABSD48_08705 [Armatimonadota bacterium]
MVRVCLWACAVVLLATAAGVQAAPEAGEFSLDQHTLFLAHFNASLREADYANGWSGFGGSGAGQTEGFWGKAVDLRGLQYRPDFLTTRDSRTPFFSDFGIWPRGNINLYQGTFEFWFKVSPDDLKQNHVGRQVLFTYWYQAGAPGALSEAELTSKGFSFDWFTLSGDKLIGSVEFGPPFDPKDWHHFALCWSQGETVVYFDGRPALSWDMKGKLGLLLYAVPHKPLCMNGIALDELRISDVVRYDGAFEPRWRDGKRPAYAFAGARGVRRYGQKLEPTSTPTALTPPREAVPLHLNLGGMGFGFDRNTGFLTAFGAARQTVARGANGLLLWEGLARSPHFAAEAESWRQTPQSLSFDQRYGTRLLIHHELTSEPNVVRWRVTFTNLTDHEVWLEALLSLPMPMPVRQYFDMSWFQDTLPFARRLDEYVFSLPFVAAAGATQSFGLGLDPHTDLSALISEWIPEPEAGTIRQGTRVVLDPKGRYALEWVLFSERAEFGARNALDHYYGLFPDLYRQDRTVPIYSYLPVSRYFEEYPYPDLARLAYTGMQWGHGPDHLKGDEFGSMLYWHMPKDPSREDYQTLLCYEDVWKSQEELEKDRIERSRRAYYHWYTLRRSHYLPNWAGKLIVEDLYPEGLNEGDPQVTGQYYDPDLYYANEYHTPLGVHYRQLTLDIMRAISAYSPGFINDMCQTSPIRFTDDIARRTPGRAFARDRGTYLVGAFGHADRYRTINGFRDARGFRQSIWSDGGVVSYQLSALSAQDVMESYIVPIDFTGVELGNQAGRNLLGEKPMGVHYANESDWTGKFFRPEDFTPKTLRDYWRYTNAQAMLSALRHGIYLPYEVIQGQQELMESNPMLVESIVWGRKTVPAAQVAEPVFVRRGGDGWNSILVVGNEQPHPVSTPVESTNRFFGARPIFGGYFGGVPRQRLGAETSVVESIMLAPRGMVGLKLLATLTGTAPGEVAGTYEGDGLTVRVVLHVRSDQPAELSLNPLAPIYRIHQVFVNGTPRRDVSSVALPAGKVEVQVEYTTPVLPFSTAEWRRVDLLSNSRLNFCLLADPKSEFDLGTAGMLNDFLRQYDEEDGVLGNLPEAPVGDQAPGGFTGWKVIVRSYADVHPSRVRLDMPAKSILVEGSSPGEARRAMVLLLRLVDRTYPHVGRFFPLPREGQRPWEVLSDDDTKRFFAAFSDPQWLIKPILKPKLEPLYAGGNLDFSGRYGLRVSPYLFEPTYADNYVYGYAGEGPAR